MHRSSDRRLIHWVRRWCCVAVAMWVTAALPIAKASGLPRTWPDAQRALWAHAHDIDGLGTLEPILRRFGYWPAERVQTALVQLARGDRAHPLVAARAAWELRRLALVRGEDVPPTALALGTIDRWSIAAAIPLDTSTCADVDPPDGPWFDVGASTLTGIVDFGRLTWRQGPCASFARASWILPRRLRVVLRLGADGPVDVFWNGDEVARLAGAEKLGLDAYAVPLDLGAGAHTLVIRSCSSGDGPWRAIVRFTDDRGRAVSMPASTATPPPGVPFGVARAIAQPPHARTPLDEELRARGERARTATDRLRVSRALALLGHDGRTVLGRDTADEFVEAAVQTRSAHEALALLGEALALEPDHLDASCMLARLEIDRLRYFPAAEALKRASTLAPTDAEVASLQARTWSDNQVYGLAAERLERALGETPDAPQLLYDRAALAHLQGDTMRAQSLMARLRPVAGLDHAPLHWLLDLALSQGRIEDASRWGERLALSHPDVASLRLEWANVALESGRRAEAEAIANEIPPPAWEHPDVLARAASLYYRMGDSTRAAALAKKALELRPQDSQLRVLQKHLAPESSRFEEAYRRNPLDLDAAYPPAPEGAGPDTEFLLDQTIVELLHNGLSSTWYQRILRVNDTAKTTERTVSILFDGYRQSLEIIRAEVWSRDGAVRSVTRRDESLLSEEWYGLYYDQRKLTLRFDGLEVGDLLVAEYRIQDVVEDAAATRFGELFVAADVVPKREVLLTLHVPDSMSIHAAMLDPTGQAAWAEDEETLESYRVIRWRMRDVPPLIREQRAPGVTEISPFLHASTFASVDEVADFYRALMRGQAESNATIAAHVRATTAQQEGTREAIAALHADLVRTFRYVGLEFGIHGYKPYACPLVFARKFGDCKDQSTLLMIMLRELGIESHLALVRTRSLGRVPSQPASLAAYNHAVLYVPALSLWVDPTATWHALGEIPYEIQGASALVVGPDRGQVLRIPEDPPTANQSHRELAVNFGNDGSAEVSGHLEHKGLFAPPPSRGVPGARRSRAPACRHAVCLVSRADPVASRVLGAGRARPPSRGAVRRRCPEPARGRWSERNRAPELDSGLVRPTDRWG